MNHYMYADALYDAYRLRDPLGDKVAMKVKAKEQALREFITDEVYRQQLRDKRDKR